MDRVTVGVEVQLCGGYQSAREAFGQLLEIAAVVDGEGEFAIGTLTTEQSVQKLADLCLPHNLGFDVGPAELQLVLEVREGGQVEVLGGGGTEGRADADERADKVGVVHGEAVNYGSSPVVTGDDDG